MKKILVTAVATLVLGIGVLGSHSAAPAEAGGWHPVQIDPATCAYLQAHGYGAYTCEQLTLGWYNGAFGR